MADSVFMFLATMMVWIMTPGIALFYGGMVKSKNVLNTAMHSYMPLAVISILYYIGLPETTGMQMNWPKIDISAFGFYFYIGILALLLLFLDYKFRKAFRKEK